MNYGGTKKKAYVMAILLLLNLALYLASGYDFSLFCAGFLTGCLLYYVPTIGE